MYKCRYHPIISPSIIIYLPKRVNRISPIEETKFGQLRK